MNVLKHAKKPLQALPNLPRFFAGCSAEMRLAAAAAMAAGKFIEAGYLKIDNFEAKGVGDLVTQVDVDADCAATEILQTSALPIVSEELNPTTNDENAKMWIVDPLDGSTAFVLGARKELTSVLIALCEDGRPILGVTYFPLTGEWFYAERGKGAMKNGVAFKMPHQELKLNECWIELNQYGNAKFETEFFGAARSRLRSPSGARIVTSNFPSAGVAMRVAEAKSGPTAAIHDNGAQYLKQGPWDIAANQIIFEEAGGCFLNPSLQPTSLFQAEPIIVSPTKKLAEEIVDCVSSGFGI